MVSASTCANSQPSGSFAGVEVATGAELRASIKSGTGSAKIDEEKKKENYAMHEDAIRHLN